MVTMEDVAEKAEVSVTTVSHVINNTRYVSPELTERVKQAVKETGYQPNVLAQGLKTQRTKTIGVIISDITNPFFSLLVKGIEDYAKDQGSTLFVCDTAETLSKEKHYIEEMMKRKVDGLIIAPTGKGDENLEKLRDNNVPFVFVDRHMEETEADAVLSDNREGAFKAVDHLINKGHTRIGIILGSKDVSTSEERYDGYQKALSKNGIPLNEKLVTRGDFQIDGAKASANKLLDLENLPTAIFTTNNMTTIGTLQAIKASDYKWPEDVEVVGFDDIDGLNLFNIPLTTVSQQPWRMGNRAAEILFKRTFESEGNTDKYKTIRLGVDQEIR